MSLTVALAVLLAALMHATWNALLRFHGDRLAMAALLAAFSGLLALPGALWLGPPAPESWPWLGTSVVLHAGYNTFLAGAYTHGDLGRIYPLARGTAPLLTLIAGWLLLNQTVEASQAAGVVVLAGGILILALEDGWRTLRRAPRGAVYALITSVFIAGYTLSDGMGARAAGEAHAYVVWLFVCNGIPLLVHGLIVRRGAMAAALSGNWGPGLVGGALSLAAYWIAIWAMTQAPIALVAALRESSVLFAVLIGVVFLRETFTWWRVLSVVSVIAGLALVRL